MTLGEPSDHLTVQDVKGRIQTGGAVPFVIVSVALNLSWPQLSFWLSTIQSLDLRFLVNRQNQGVIGRVQIQTNHIKNLLGKVWIVADFEGFQTVRLQLRSPPNLLYLPAGDAGMFCHQSKTPMGEPARNLMDSVIQNGFDLFLIKLSGLSWPWGIVQPC